MSAITFSEVLKFNPYHDSKGRFSSADSATSFTYAPGKSTAHDNAIQRAKDADAASSGKGFKGTLYHGSPAKDIEEFDMSRAGANTSSGEKLLYFTDSKQLADDFSYERLEGSTKFFQRRGEKGRVYEVDVEIKNPLDFRNLSDKDIDNILKLDVEGILTREDVKSLSSNHQLLKTNLDLRAESLKKLGYDGLIANTGKAGHYALEYAVVDSKQATIRKGLLAKAMTFDEILKFNPYHDSRGRFASADSATLFTIRTQDPSKQQMADMGIRRERERDADETASGSAYEKDMDEEQEKVLSMKPNEQALYVFEHDGETQDNCVSAMENGETEALVKNYFSIMKANGDPTPVNPTSGQVKSQLKNEVEYGRKYNGYEEARIDYIQKMTGMDADEAAATMKEFNKWFGGSWGSADTETLDNYISKDHVYDGKMYRGMKFTPEGFDSFMENVSPGATISMKRNSSWTSDEAVARSFGGHASDVVFSVMVTCVKNRTSAPVDHLSTSAESEVLAHSKARWSVLHSEVVTWPSGAKKAYLTVVETGE